MLENNMTRRLLFAIINVGVAIGITKLVSNNAPDVDRILVFLLSSLAVYVGYGFGIFMMISKYNHQITEAIKALNESGTTKK